MAKFTAGRKPLPEAQKRTRRIRFQTDTRAGNPQIYSRLQRLFRQSDEPDILRGQGWEWQEGEGLRSVELTMTESEYDLLGSLAEATGLSKAAILRGAVRGDALIAHAELVDLCRKPSITLEPSTDGTPHPQTP